MKKIIKYVVIAVVGVTAISAIAVAAMQPPAVECVALEISTLENTFNEVGEVVPLFESDIFSKHGGTLLEVIVDEGAAVQQGDLLFVFDGKDMRNQETGILSEISVVESQIKGQVTSLQMQKDSFAADLAAVQVQLEAALIEEKKQQESLASAKSLHDIGAISAQDLANAQTASELSVKSRELAARQRQFLSAQISAINGQINDLSKTPSPGGETAASQNQQLLAQKAALETSLGLLHENQGELEVFAASAGIVRDMPLKAGQIIHPGAKLCSVYQPGQYKVECYIFVENTEGIKAGDEVEVTLRMRNEDIVFRGSIARLAHDAVEKVSNVGLNEKRIKVEIDSTEDVWQSIGPYWPVEIRFITAQALNCLIVPKTALFEDGEDVWKVWTVQGGKLTAIKVEKGVETPSQVEIKGGIGSGDIIVRNPKTSNVGEGLSVRVVLH